MTDQLENFIRDGNEITYTELQYMTKEQLGNLLAATKAAGAAAVEMQFGGWLTAEDYDVAPYVKTVSVAAGSPTEKFEQSETGMVVGVDFDVAQVIGAMKAWHNECLLCVTESYS